MRVLGLAAGVLSLVLAGCGGSGLFKPTGQVTIKGGGNLTVGDKGLIQVTFFPEGGEKISYGGNVKNDGSFEINGPAGKGIPPGKYLVTVRALDPYHPVQAKDKLGERYTGKNGIPIEVTGSGPITLEVQTK